MTTLPSFTLLTNDNVEPVHPEVRLFGAALRFTHYGYRGLFGGIWRTGRTYDVDGMGPCLGPEVFYPIGSTAVEARAAFGCSRGSVLGEQARIARAAFQFVAPIARELGGAAHLHVVRREGDRHVLHVFLPVTAIMKQFTPRDWFLFWRIQDSKFRASTATPAQPGANGQPARRAMPVPILVATH